MLHRSYLSVIPAQISSPISHSNSHCCAAIARAVSMTTRRQAAAAAVEYGKVESFTVPSGTIPSNTRVPQSISVQRIYLSDDGTYPNNPHYPTLLLKSVFDGSQEEGVGRITNDGQWTTPWAWGIFDYHHYHIKAWELLLCVRGEASVQLGGPTGPTVSISCGDSVLIPPGVAHKQLGTRGGFMLLGAYPTEGFDGSIDTLTGRPTDGERERIKECHVPWTEPITGLNVKELCKITF